MNPLLSTTPAALAGLLLIGALSVMNRIELAHLAETNPGEVRDARIEGLAARLAELAGEIEPFRQSPTVPLTRFVAERESVERRLATVEQAVIERPGDDLQPLRERLARLEERLTPPANPVTNPSVNPPAPPSPAPSHAAPRARIGEPSFRVVGVERRADERFLTILPGKTAALSQARLLRVGDTADGWRLDAIGDESATFSQAGRKRRLSLSGDTK
jgi:hypothetical protein